MPRVLTFSETQKFKPTVQWLMHEFKLDEAKAWATATDPKRALAFIASAPAVKNEAARRAALRTVKLSEQQAAVRRSRPMKASEIPGTTINAISKHYGLPIDFKVPAKSRDETPEEYRRRLLHRSIATPTDTAKAVDTAADSEASFAEAEAGNLKRKRALLSDSKLRAAEEDRRTERAVEGLKVTAASDTTSLRDRALALMRSRGQNTQVDRYHTPVAVMAVFHEQYKAAFSEVSR